MRYEFHPAQKITKNEDGTLIVAFHADGLLEMAWHIFTWSGEIVPLAPVELVAEYQKLLRKAADTLDDMLNKQRNILSESVFYNGENINYTVCGVSAMKALAARDTSITRLYDTDTVLLTDSKRRELYLESNFDQTMNSIKQFMESGFERSHLSTLRSVYNFFDRTGQIISSQYEIQNALWAESDNAQIALRTQQLLDNWESWQSDNIDKLDNFIVSKMSECRRLALNEFKRLLEELENAVPGLFNDIKTPDEWDIFNKENKMGLAIADSSNEIRKSIGDFLVKFGKNTHNLAILRIQEYSSLTDAFTEQELPGFQSKISDGAINPFVMEANDLEKEISDLNQSQTQQHKFESEKKQLQEKEQDLLAELNKKHLRRKTIKNEFDKNKRRLGKKPEASYYYEDVIDYEYRGGFGIFDTIFGPKETTRSVKRTDYSAQNRWVEDERTIKNAYNKQKSKLNIQLSSLEMEIESAKHEITEINKTMKSYAERINTKEAIIKDMRESLELKRTRAAKEYVQKQKDKLKNNVSDYIWQILQPSLEDIIGSETVRMENDLSSVISALYAEVSRNQKENLRQMLNENRGSDSVLLENLNSDMESIYSLKKNLEVYLCKHQVPVN